MDEERQGGLGRRSTVSQEGQLERAIELLALPPVPRGAPCRAPVRVSTSHGPAVATLTRLDISDADMDLPVPMTVGATLSLVLPLPELRSALAVRVTRCTPAPGGRYEVHVLFTRVDSVLREQLVRAVKALRRLSV